MTASGTRPDDGFDIDMKAIANAQCGDVVAGDENRARLFTESEQTAAFTANGSLDIQRQYGSPSSIPNGTWHTCSDCNSLCFSTGGSGTQGGGGEGPNYNPVLWAISAPLQADSAQLTTMGLRPTDFTDNPQGGGQLFLPGLAMHLLHPHLPGMMEPMTLLAFSSQKKLMLCAGVAAYVSSIKVQQLHVAQWNLDRIDQLAVPLDHQYGCGLV